MGSEGFEPPTFWFLLSSLHQSSMYKCTGARRSAELSQDPEVLIIINDYIFYSYLVSAVPVFPFKHSVANLGDVIKTSSPSLSSSLIEASIFGPILPFGK